MTLFRGVLAFVFATIVVISRADDEFEICENDYCECIPSIHPAWSVVNCSLPADQNLQILEDHIPPATTDLLVTGGAVITFGPHSLSLLSDARRVQISGARRIYVNRHAAVDLRVVNIHLMVDHCELLQFEDESFSNLLGPLSVTVDTCLCVRTASRAFSWLLSMQLSNVPFLQLSPHAFELDPKAGNVGSHGASLSIKMKNVEVVKLPFRTFGSSAAEIIMKNVKINEIQEGAFSAITYNTVAALNCSIHHIKENAFSPISLIDNLTLQSTKIILSSKALQSAVGVLKIINCTFDDISPGAINMTVASAEIEYNIFHKISERGVVLSSWTKLSMKRNSFDELTSDAIIAFDTNNHQIGHELIFIENEIETVHPGSLKFIGMTQGLPLYNVVYKDNYYGQACMCNVMDWLSKALQVSSTAAYASESYCVIDDFFARCFNVPEQNMQIDKFLKGVCQDERTINCESYPSDATEIKNPRFPHIVIYDDGLSSRNAKVIGIVLGTCLGCALLAMLISLIRWMRRKGYCRECRRRICPRGPTNGIDNARSISRLSVHEYSERHRLNEPTSVQIEQHSNMQDDVVNVPTYNKGTQTLPIQLTKTMLDSLKEKLDNPKKYLEARETIEHLYDLIKLEETNPEILRVKDSKKKMYETPYQRTVPHLGKNKKQMVSVGTRAPSLDKLSSGSYDTQIELNYEYVDPQDIALHLYAEIANPDPELRQALGSVPDVVAQPRGPYLKAVQEKQQTPSSSSVSPAKSITSSFGSPLSTCTMKSSSSNASGQMMNRPLPEKPFVEAGTGAGTSKY